ncbi:MAG: hypothetical protein ACLFRB_10770 [Thiohalorhabdus sp.]|uniref:hypothetical protein n=1 Tax=Thiohalorhabdus sp. TaxID=3094134 RepID=UPI00397EE0BA
MLWRTIRAYFLPSAHPGLEPVKDRHGEELFPKRDEYGERVEDQELEVWASHRADRRRERNRALVRPYMGLYIRRWAVLGGFLWAASELLGWAGLPLGSWLVFSGAVLAFLMVVMLLLLRQEMSS